MAAGYRESKDVVSGELTALRSPGAVTASLLTALLLALAAVLACLCFAMWGAASARAALPTATASWWHLESSAVPTYLPPGGEGEIVVTASNLGDKAIDGEGANTVTITDGLPEGLKPAASAISGKLLAGGEGERGSTGTLKCTLASLSCTFSGILEPYAALQITITMKAVPLDAPSGEGNEVTVTGGGAPAASLRRPITVSSVATPFGVENYELTPESEDGSLETQAGSHPFQLTTTIALNRTGEAKKLVKGEEILPQEVGLAKDLDFKWPAGLSGNPTVFPQCTARQFADVFSGGAFGGAVNACPPDTAVGVVSLTINEPRTLHFQNAVIPLFNIEPEVGEPARFGFELLQTLVVIDPSIRTGGDYGITVSGNDITEVTGYLSAVVTVWGVPGDPRHNHSRGWECTRGEAGCAALDESNPPPFLTLPTSCTEAPLQTSVEADSWQKPGDVLVVAPSEAMPTLTGCERLPFSPEIKASPDGQQASSPSGLLTDVHVPQEGQLNPTGLAQSNIKDIKVTLPEGVTLNPAGANGLEACSEGLVGYLPGQSSPPSELDFTSYLPGSTAALAAGDSEALQPGANFCPNASKVGTVKITTPLLPNPLEGAVYLAAQDANPFGSLVAMYIVAEDPVSGSLVKLPGKVSLNQETGQIEATFENTPQLAFEDAELHFFGGENAPLSTPAHCGTYTTQATFTPWSGNEAVKSSSSFQITSGPGGGPCPPATLPFAPSLDAGMSNIQAGSFSALDTTIGREDGEQNLQSVQLQMPAGLSGMLSTVKLCGEAQANAGTCGPESEIGETIVSVGLGGDPYTVKGGKVFITGPYEGAPFGLSIVNPAVAGPYNLGQVIVRAKIEVNPLTAALTITTDPSGPYAIPHILDGIPLQIKHVNVTISRPGFTFNPTSCQAMSITGSLASSEGSSSTIAIPFQVANCAALKFKPAFSASTSGKTSRKQGASLHVNVSYPKEAFGGEANLRYAKVELPKALPSRLSTLQKACTASQFAANPAGCPAESVVGHAVVHTPVLPVPLEGPAYFVSNGSAAFPNLVIILQGYGVTVELVGNTLIKKGVTSSTFAATPDVPFESFELTLPQGEYSALAANGNLCQKKLVMPIHFIGQSGATLNQSTRMEVQGCRKTLAVVSKKLKSRTLTLKIAVPSKGKLQASGKGLSSASKSASGRETITIKLDVKSKGKVKSKVKVKLSFKPAKGKKLSKTLKARI